MPPPLIHLPARTGSIFSSLPAPISNPFYLLPAIRDPPIPWQTRPHSSPVANVLDFATAFRRLQLRRYSRPPAAEEVPVVVCSAPAQAPLSGVDPVRSPLPAAAVAPSQRAAAEALEADCCSQCAAAEALVAAPRSARRREKRQMLPLAWSSAGSWPSPRAATAGSAWTPWRVRLPDSSGRATVVYIGKAEGCLSQAFEHPFDLYPTAAKKFDVVAQCRLEEEPSLYREGRRLFISGF